MCIYIYMSNTCHTHQLQGAGLARRDPTGDSKFTQRFWNPLPGQTKLGEMVGVCDFEHFNDG